MKILFPCPGCRHPLVLPRHASSLAKLRCSVCGHKLTAESIFLDSSQLGSEWEVVDDTGTDDVFNSLHHAASLRDLEPSAINGQVIREPSVVIVPPSNEWETQSSSLLVDEALEPAKEYQIASEFRASEVGNRGETSDFETESMPDEMIGVSDEPWFSPTKQPVDALTDSEVEMEDEEDEEEVEIDSEIGMEDPTVSERRDDRLQVSENWDNDLPAIDFDSEPEEKDDLSLENTPASEEESLAFEADEEPVLTLDEDELDEFNPIEEPDEVSSEQEQPTIPAAAEVRPRTSQTLPAELLGNSNSVLRSRKKSNPIGTLVSIVGGGVAAIPISILLMWYALGKDPLAAGPMVASFAPWIVPEKFQGVRFNNAEALPEMPPMVGPGFSDIASGGPMKLPSIGDTTTSEPATPSGADTPTAEPAMNPVDQPAPTVGPEATVGTTEASNPLAMAPSIDNATLPPSIPEMPKLEPVSEVNSATLPSTPTLNTESNGLTSLDTPEPSVSKIEQSILNLKKAIEVFDGGAYESGAILFRSLESFGEQLASIPESSPERADWRSKGLEVAQRIASSADMLKSFRQFMTTSNGNTELFPGESLQSREPTVTVDVVQVDSIQSGDDHDIWTIKQRFQSTLDQRPIIVPHSLNVPASPAGAYLVLGVSEVDPNTRELVLRAFMAVQKK
jgi:LSD1 subclass zinc finger protein